MIAILLLFRLMVGVDGVIAVLFDAVVPTLDDVRWYRNAAGDGTVVVVLVFVLFVVHGVNTIIGDAPVTEDVMVEVPSSFRERIILQFFRSRVSSGSYLELAVAPFLSSVSRNVVSVLILTIHRC